MKKIAIIFNVIVIFSCCAIDDWDLSLKFEDLPPALAVEKKNMLLVKMTDKAPVVDGHLDEVVWEKSSEIELQSVRTDRAISPRSSTKAYVISDEQNLYLGFICKEPDMNKIKSANILHDSPIWTDDCIEVFISPTENIRSYYHIAINSNGTIYDAICRLDESNNFMANMDWNSDCIVKTAKGEDFWSLEMALPLKNVAIYNKSNLAKINLVRERKVLKENSSLNAVSPFHQASAFSYMSFQNKHYTITDWAITESSVKITLKNEDCQNQELTADFKILAPQGEISYNSESFIVSAGDFKHISLPVKKIEKAGSYKIVINISDSKSGIRYCSIDDELIVQDHNFKVKMSLANTLLFCGERFLKADIQATNPFFTFNELKAKIAIQRKENRNIQIIGTKEFSKILSPSFTLSLNTATLSVGDYTLKIVFMDESDKILFQTEKPFWIINGY